MNKEIEIPEGYEARIEGNKVILEPKANEDERIRKELIEIVSAWKNREPHGYCNVKYLSSYEIDKINKILAYLEKQKEPKDVSASTMAPGCWQGEEKSAGWSEEEKGILLECISALQNSSHWLLADKLSSLRPQPKQEWSEEDEKAINDLMWCIAAYRKGAFNKTHIEIANRAENWLKSLRPQPHWKPSEEQMDHLAYAYTQLKLQKCYAPHVYETLGSLYDDLKKLI